MGKEERHQQYKAFFAIVNLDEVVSQSPARKMVNLFQIKVPEAPISLDDENWRERYTDNLQFEPTKLGLNQQETAFVLYGPRGILVGNFPQSNH